MCPLFVRLGGTDRHCSSGSLSLEEGVLGELVGAVARTGSLPIEEEVDQPAAVSLLGRGEPSLDCRVVQPQEVGRIGEEAAGPACSPRPPTPCSSSWWRAPAPSTWTPTPPCPPSLSTRWCSASLDGGDTLYNRTLPPAPSQGSG